MSARARMIPRAKLLGVRSKDQASPRSYGRSIAPCIISSGRWSRLQLFFCSMSRGRTVGNSPKMCEKRVARRGLCRLAYRMSGACHQEEDGMGVDRGRLARKTRISSGVWLLIMHVSGFWPPAPESRSSRRSWPSAPVNVRKPRRRLTAFTLALRGETLLASSQGGVLKALKAV